MSKLMPWGIAYPLPKWSHLRNGKFKFKLLWSVNVKIVVLQFKWIPPHSPLVPTQSNMIHGALVAHTHTEYSRSIIQVRTINNAQRLRRWSMYTYVLSSMYMYVCVCVCTVLSPWATVVRGFLFVLLLNFLLDRMLKCSLSLIVSFLPPNL